MLPPRVKTISSHTHQAGSLYLLGFGVLGAPSKVIPIFLVYSFVISIVLPAADFSLSFDNHFHIYAPIENVTISDPHVLKLNDDNLIMLKCSSLC